MKYFKLADIFVYIAVALTVLMLFILLLGEKGSGIESIEVYRANDLIFAYSFGSDKFEAYCDGVSTERDGEHVYVTLDFYGKLNSFVIDAKSKTVSMINANCPGHDCVKYFSKIEKENQIIICAPNGIKIVGKGPGAIIIPAG